MSVDAKRVQAIFLMAVETEDPDQQATILDRECSADANLRREVESLLHVHCNPASMLDRQTRDIDDAAGANGRQDPAGRDRLDFLASSTKPGSLGRIGHYEVLEILGRGGFGIVLRAHDESLRRAVAVKVLAPEMAVTSPPRKRFLREARAYAAIRHENVVQVFAVEEQPLPHIVMEFVPGGTLQQLLDRTGPLAVVEVLTIGRQIAEGLAAAHSTGLVHRDVKPSNVLIDDGSRRVKLTDFGLARAADDATISGSGLVLGTPLYMAPEQARGEAVDHRADLFSLGSVLYVMCTGRPPFRADGTLAVLKRVCEDTPRPVREIIPETPVWLCELIARLHPKNPADRFQSAREVADLLRRYEGEWATHGRVVPAVFPPSRNNRRRTARLIAAAAMLLALLAFALYLGLGPKDGRKRDDRPRPGSPTVRGPRSKLSPVLNGIPARLPRAGRTSWFAQDREGKWLAVPCENDVALFDAHTMEPVYLLHAAAERVFQVDFSPDGKRLAVGSWSEDESVTVWDLETGEPDLTLNHQGKCWSVRFSPDGSRLLTVGEHHVPIVWNAKTGAELHRFPHQVQPVCADATFSADGNQIVTHVRGGDLTVWDAQTWKPIRTLSGPERVTEDESDWLHYPLVVSRDGKWLAAGSPSGFKFWATDTWTERPTVKDTPATWLAFAPDGRTILTAAHEYSEDRLHAVARWQTETGEPLKPMTLASRGPWAVYLPSVDGKALYAMACDPAEPRIHVYNLETLEEK